MAEVEMVTPYCGGCGHRFFAEPAIAADDAKKEAVKRRCYYCLDDAREDKKPKQKSPPPAEYWLDF